MAIVTTNLNETGIRLYVVRALFPNPNADFDMKVGATSKTNAIWRAAEMLRGTGATIGDIRRA